MKVKVDTYQIITQSGKIIDFQNIDVKQIELEDIVTGLSNVCRYSGQVSEFYSVAEHCMMVSDYVPKRLRKYALLHDAAEAYMGDVPRPVKLLCPGYKAIEAKVEAAILARFNIPVPSDEDHATVKVIDNRALLTEAAELKVGDIGQWLDVPGMPLPALDGFPGGRQLDLLTPEEAATEYGQMLYAEGVRG
jgi:hypothetical protein